MSRGQCLATGILDLWVLILVVIDIEGEREFGHCTVMYSLYLDQLWVSITVSICCKKELAKTEVRATLTCGHNDTYLDGSERWLRCLEH